MVGGVGRSVVNYEGRNSLERISAILVATSLSAALLCLLGQGVRDVLAEGRTRTLSTSVFCAGKFQEVIKFCDALVVRHCAPVIEICKLGIRGSVYLVHVASERSIHG
jgi:hypothetical protein